ncbi:hypothetical protein FRACYDRAFT_239056 [Fragilariopsis cylindrus CCMP1102]|uniref:Uncharacterized protein n=1 Tax=Fragilariopsis cylindrus CCMP1102 TaxID=635003 RepID=A0A1E7FE97_9STRA|nr:hypothetical protein FRACYDRAFT_239056 [Fragilariopsis cylindrus CCMP1102]|eukprot:OEU16464.1 hypothetical protein FRACYDRAFT_239056 [Fragilariopsis cylindrus CCMP1102]
MSDFLDQAEAAAKETIKVWIKQVLRESFLQALRKAWTLQSTTCANNQTNLRNSLLSSSEEDDSNYNKNDNDNNTDPEYQVGWQDSTTTSNVEAAEETQRSLSVEDDDERSEQRLVGTINNIPHHTSNNDNNNDEDDFSSSTNTKRNHPWVYNKLRSLGRKSELEYSSLSVPDALNEIKDFTSKYRTYWPLDNNIIDQESIRMSQRMRARDRHGAGGGGSSSGGGNRDGSSYTTKKTVKFKVVPKSFTSIPTTTTQKNDQQKSTIIETLLLARKKKNSTYPSLQPPRKRKRMVEHKEIPRVPFDFSTTSNGNPAIELSFDEKKELNKLLVLNNNNNNNEKEDEGSNNNNNNNDSSENSKAIPTSTKPEITLGLFGGLQHVGQTSHFLQNPSEINNNSNNNMVFMANRDDSNTGNNNKILRRKQKVSIQERIDPNRLQQRTDVGTPKKSKSKFLRTENWFDNQKKYFDLDLGWCLLEITVDDEKGGGNQQKRLCAFSSMEICLDDND